MRQIGVLELNQARPGRFYFYPLYRNNETPNTLSRHYLLSVRLPLQQITIVFIYDSIHIVRDIKLRIGNYTNV